MKARILSVMVLAMAISAFASAADFKVIVNNSVPVTSLTKKATSDLFLKKTTKWAGGEPVLPVDQLESAAVRLEFSKSVHSKAVAAIKSYWNQQIFSGREVPPVEKRSDAEVLSFVRSTPGAIGYVAETAVTGGVRVVTVD